MSQTREDEDGYTIVKCVYCGKLFKFLNASPEHVESLAFCGNRCRELYFWYFGMNQFKELEGKKHD